MDAIRTETITHKGRAFEVRMYADDDQDAPWDREDGHGPVREGERHSDGHSDKKPGERPLNSADRRERQFFYDWREALRIARRDGWGMSEEDRANWLKVNGREPSAREVAEFAVAADFARLRGWLAQDWQYIGVAVRALGADGEPVGDEFAHSCWGVESDGDYWREVAKECAEECIAAIEAQEAQTMRLAVLPFSGFYNSYHDSELDMTLDRMFSDRDTGCEVFDGLVAYVFDACDWSQVHAKYAQRYAEEFGREFRLSSLRYESMRSPREYNFETDRIFVELNLTEVREVLARVDRARLDQVACDTFTSRSGFISSYSPDVEDWGDVASWDHNQLFALLTAYADQETNSSDGFDSYAELGLMQSAGENGAIDQWISESCPDEKIQKAFRVFDYLETRAHR